MTAALPSEKVWLSREELHDLGNELQAIRIGIELCRSEALPVESDVGDPLVELEQSVSRLIDFHTLIRQRLDRRSDIM